MTYDSKLWSLKINFWQCLENRKIFSRKCNCAGNLMSFNNLNFSLILLYFLPKILLISVYVYQMFGSTCLTHRSKSESSAVLLSIHNREVPRADVFFPSFSLDQLQRHIQNPIIHLRGSLFFAKIANVNNKHLNALRCLLFSQKLHLRCWTWFWIRFWVEKGMQCMILYFLLVRLVTTKFSKGIIYHLHKFQ